MEGEKNTKYFFNLEKSNYNAKTCYVIYDEEKNKMLEDPNEILEVQRKFYTTLYKRDENIHFDLTNTHNVLVPDQHMLIQNSMISMEELTTAVMSMAKNKTPGYDGLTADFYQTFWEDLKCPFMEMLNKTYEDKILHPTALQGVLNLIPKSNKDSRYVKNLRPITLLNTDYKVIEKCIANKIMPSLTEIINKDQRGFMPERRISVNIRKLLDLAFYAIENHLEMLIVSLDFAKCFDRVSFSILHGALDYFKFGDIVKDWTYILYNGFKVRVQNNGKFSNEIKIEKGIHQGGCCSSLYFLIVAEILALELRANDQIKGITINEIKNILNQFADDLDLFSENSQSSLRAIFQTLENFRLHSGFTISYDKTTIYRTGSLRFSNAELYSISNITWTAEKIRVLGITVSNDNIIENNYNEIINKAKEIMNNWTHRSLTLIGKVNIVNTLVASLFVYRMQVLPSMYDRMYKMIDNEIVRFLWDGKRPKIALKILKSLRKSGGLQLIDLRTKNLAIKVSWIQILQYEKDYAEIVYSIIAPELRHDIWRCSLESQDVPCLGIKNDFWQEIVIAWAKYNFIQNTEVPNQILWWNSHIRIQNKPVFFKHAHVRGLKYVHQLFQENGNIKSALQVARQFNLSFMEFNQLVVALPAKWRTFFRNNHPSSYMPITLSKYDIELHSKNLSNKVYKFLVDQPFVCIEKQQKWKDEFECEFTFDQFTASCNNINKVTNIVKYRSFQYRLIQRSIITNTRLYQWKISESKNCTFCNDREETVKHLFFECDIVQDLWRKVIMYIERRFPAKTLSLTYSKVITNTINSKPGDVTNFICLITKQYIYSQRCLQKQLTMWELEAKINLLERIERYGAYKSDKIKYHENKWMVSQQTMPHITDLVNQYVCEL